jgi:hypothetical protein
VFVADKEEMEDELNVKVGDRTALYVTEKRPGRAVEMRTL